MILLRIKAWLWERRLAHAREVHSGLEREFCAEIARAKHEVEHCETMASGARMEMVKSRADKAKARRMREAT